VKGQGRDKLDKKMEAVLLQKGMLGPERQKELEKPSLPTIRALKKILL